MLTRKDITLKRALSENSNSVLSTLFWFLVWYICLQVNNAGVGGANVNVDVLKAQIAEVHFPTFSYLFEIYTAQAW